MLASRRRTLGALTALGLAALTSPGATQHAGPAPKPAPRGVDWCGSGRNARPLYVPKDVGYLGRLAPAGEPLTLTASRVGPAPPGLTRGPFAFRVSHRGRDYLNPTLVLRPAERVRVALVNRIDAPTIVHWHGLGVDARNDGNGLTVVEPGRTFDYDFEVRDRSALYWYHPHPHGITAGQLYGGLFGTLEIEDADDQALRKTLDLAPGRTEITLAMQDRRSNPVYEPARADLMHGFFGDEIAINGTACAFLDVASRLYRFRMLNACNARTLLVALRTTGGARLPFTVIGNDGGLLPAPVRAEQAYLATAERLDVLVDLRDAQVGETVVLESLAFDPMHNEVAEEALPATPAHGGAHAHAAQSTAGTWAEGTARPLLELRVRERIAYDRNVPAMLSRVAAIDVTKARERPLRLGFNKGRWRINDRVFAMGEAPIEVARDTTEVWLLRNYHTSMPHAMHLHGFHFQILERETSPDPVRALAIDERGRLPADLGRRDTVLVWPGESIRMAIDFTMPFQGPQTYMFHCHNLEHEDGGMMLGVRVA